MNQQVDQIAETWQIKRLETWASDANLVPRRLEEIRNLFLQDQREAAWTVIDQYLTEPINALMEQQDQNDPWATEWDN
ncbi:hypothetical protein [Corynebacterium cystitidis]|nr:hypothetical protein [Corynebacterium cystitidis]